MKTFLQKLLEVTRWLYGTSTQIAGRVYAFLGSVEIDQPRGVLLCVALQLFVLLGLVVGFRRTVTESTQASLGKKVSTQSLQPPSDPEPTPSTESSPMP